MEAKCQRLDRWEGKEKNERYMLLREERRRKGGGREGKGEREEKRERSKRSGEERRKRRREGESAVFRTSRKTGRECVHDTLQSDRRSLSVNCCRKQEGKERTGKKPASANPKMMRTARRPP
jgi:hypothetical protein